MRFRCLSVLRGVVTCSLAAFTAFAGCSNQAGDCKNTDTCSPPSDAGDAGACSDPATQPCAISNERGVFVSAANGSDAEGAADGTREKPFRSVGKALATAKTANKNIYVCAGAGDYAESQTLTIDATFSGVSLFGGFNCADWTYGTTLKAKIVSQSPNAIVVDGVTSGMQISDFEVQAADAADAGASSLAVQVKHSQGVALRRMKITAGSGANGAPGAPGQKGADGADPRDEQKGKSALCPAGELTTQPGGDPASGSTCGSRGGRGGAAAKSAVQNGGDGESGTPTTNLREPDVDNHGVGATGDGNGGNGDTGGRGNPGPNAAAAPAAGTWTASGFVPPSGLAGTAGFPGQGGGGGGASKGSGTCVGASGGAGGMGGCGGGAGQGGGGGGASVALFVWQSAVTLDSCELVSKNGGAGGVGGDGNSGGAGRSGAAGGDAAGTVSAGGRGGDGGTGGPGGSGSGGSGGPSYAMVAAANAVTRVGTNTLTAGDGGERGVGGSLLGLGDNRAPSGSVGASEQTHALQ